MRTPGMAKATAGPKRASSSGMSSVAVNEPRFTIQ